MTRYNQERDFARRAAKAHLSVAEFNLSVAQVTQESNPGLYDQRRAEWRAAYDNAIQVGAIKPDPGF